MRKTFLKSFAIVVISLLLTTGAAYAASINITTLLGGNAGDTFVLSGKFKTNKLVVKKLSTLKGQLKVLKKTTLQKLRVEKKARFKDEVNFDGDVNFNSDVNGLSMAAADVSYNNAASGLTATDTQAAVDEVVADNLPSVLSFFENESTWNVTWGSYNDSTYTETTTNGDGDQMTITFTPTSETEGTYSANFMWIQDGANLETGTYKIAGRTLFAEEDTTDQGMMRTFKVLSDTQLTYIKSSNSTGFWDLQ